MKKLVLVFNLLLILSINIFSQQNFWQQTNGPYGAFIYSLANGLDGIIYAGTMTQGLYKSSLEEYNWTKIGLEGKSIYSILQYSHNLIFVATSSGFFYSNDEGTNWILNSAIINPTTLFKTLSGTILVGSNQAIYRSTDEGNNWQNVTSNMPNLSIYNFTSDSDGRLYSAAQTRGILISTDDGVTWIMSNNGIPITNYSVSAIFVKDNSHLFACISPANYFSAEKGIYMSTDSGLSWFRRTNTITNVSQFAVNHSGELMAGIQDGGNFTGTGGVFYSNDLGISWNLYTNQAACLDVRALITTPSGNILAGNYYAGIYLSSDTGQSWVNVNTGINNCDITDVYTSSSGRIFCSKFSLYNGHGGAYYSDDEGNSWIKMNTGNDDPNVRVFFSDDNGTLYAGDNGIYRSTNGGIDWQYVQSGNSVQCFTQTLNGTMLAGDYDLGIFRSTNDGLTWGLSNAGLTNNAIFCIATTNSGSILAGSFEGKIFRSVDDGLNWETVNIPSNGTVLSLYKSSSNNIFAGTNSGWGISSFFVSSDNGLSWQSNNTFLGKSIRDIVENSLGEIFVGCEYEGVYKSQNNGQTFFKLNNQGLSDLRIQTLTVSSLGYVYAGTWRGSIFRSIGSTTDIVNEKIFNVSRFSLSQNYPNPFNPSTKIRWQSPVSGWQTLKVYDVLGNEVATLVNEYRSAGSYEIEFNPASSIKRPASGIYFYRLQAGDYVETKKMILLK